MQRQSSREPDTCAHTETHTNIYIQIPHAANRMGTGTSLQTETRCFQDAPGRKETALLRLTPSVILSTSISLVNPTKFVSSLSFFPCLCRPISTEMKSNCNWDQKRGVGGWIPEAGTKAWEEVPTDWRPPDLSRPISPGLPAGEGNFCGSHC